MNNNLKTKENAKLLIIFSSILLGIDVIYIICGSLVPVFGLLLAIASIVFFILTVVYGFKTGSREPKNSNRMIIRKLSIALIALFAATIAIVIVAIIIAISLSLGAYNYEGPTNEYNPFLLVSSTSALYIICLILSLAELGILIALLCFAVKIYCAKNNNNVNNETSNYGDDSQKPQNWNSDNQQ
ncbi:hypothetical protein DRW55_00095 [Metamycoplasma hominis]|uniref:hypothetical protein n=1 Tax=Metamycoplasma hominis TaxID=2098 RepID=UPI000DDF035C|nr:hypothetical protein [Metamycoplasma hominis]RBI47079.1 hypothetical protein DRW55_00095 [Metamycoplasma hominis]